MCSRHLQEFGFEVEILYPKKTDKPLYLNLLKQCYNYNINLINPEEFVPDSLSNYDLVIDAIFGFSFNGEPRPPFNSIIENLYKSKYVVSIDIPSGWNVDNENRGDNTFTPSMLVSLTLPKLCSKSFKGSHYLGGRFIPNKLKEKFSHLTFPNYSGFDQIIKLN